MRSPAFELCVGGAAGPGKTAFILIEALRHVHRTGYHALILRREAKQLRTELLPAAHEIYPKVGGKWKPTDSCFYWPSSGARIEVGGVQSENDVHKYQGASLQYLAFDELTHFTLAQYLYMWARCRENAACPDVVPRIRNGTNPGSIGHEWVLDRWAPFLYPPPGDPNHDSSYKGPYAEPGQILWYLKDLAGNDRIVPPWTPDAKTRSFYPGRLQDNPIYLGGSYEATLKSMAKLDREQLLGGNWMARPEPGMFFQRAWFAHSFVGAAPAQVVARVRYWDFASTPASRANHSTAYTAGVLLSRTADNRFWLEDVVRGQWSPGMAKATVKATALTDPEGTRVVIEHDPAQAGDAQAFDYVTTLSGLNIQAVHPHGDKMLRCKPASSQAEVGNLMIVKADWNGPFLREAEGFPEGLKDQIDALSGAFNQIAMFPAYRGRSGGRRDMTSKSSAY